MAGILREVNRTLGGSVKSEIITVKGVAYVVPRKQKYAMWRFRFSNGRTVWLQVGDEWVIGLGTQIKCDWLDDQRFVLHWPVGDSAYPYEFQLGRWAI